MNTNQFSSIGLMSQLKYFLGTLTNQKSIQTTDLVKHKKDNTIMKCANCNTMVHQQSLKRCRICTCQICSNCLTPKTDDLCYICYLLQ